MQLLVMGTHANHNKWWTCNDACARCVRRVMPMEEMITQLYPGLFSNTPPSNSVPVTGDLTLPVAPPNSTSNQSFIDSGSNPRTGNLDPGTTANPSGCCETIMEYATPLNVTIGGRIYKVVHLQHMFQFIPVGRCKRPRSKCGAGQCVDQYRAHWVLVYNSTQPLQGAAPVSFAPIEVSSHCECLNVGH
ncbi:hypothetical protein C0Q70_20374 [Pomacea canaliculata]|uniref:Spaetzle domain-containing protein n=2 Tax=Pomacea canaliculata TaxID=400727 RepID=A0A2T7NFE0_POMCA|nr:hypothetical protein C0Q70_20374 [Pomacea canaliculata]